MKVYRDGKALLDSMRDAERSPELDIWYLGQESFLIRYGKTTLLLDPFLSDYVAHCDDLPEGMWVRNYESPVDPSQLDFIDYVLCSHDHLDHLDPWTVSAIAKASPKARFIVPDPIVPKAVEYGVALESITGAVQDRLFSFDGFSLLSIGAAHPVLHKDLGKCRELSYVIRFDNGISLFFGGDMYIYGALLEKLKEIRIDIAMLPINGGGWKRESRDIIGNCTFRDAADFAAEISADLVIPMHFDLYPVNDENPAYFVDYTSRAYSHMKYHIFKVGERFTYVK